MEEGERCSSGETCGSSATTTFPLFTLVSHNHSPKVQELSTLVTSTTENNTTNATYYTSYTGFYSSTPLGGLEPDAELLVMIPMLMLSLVGVYGNSVVIYTLTNLDKKSHHMLVMLSLAFSDFISCCFLMPCICLSSVTRGRPLGDRWCEIFPYLNTTVLYCSFGHLGVISFEQCFRLWNPALYKQMVTRNVIKFICLFVWLFSAVGFLYPIRRLMSAMYYEPVHTCLLIPKQPSFIGEGISKEQAEKERSILYGVTIGYKLLILLLMSFSYCLIFIKLSRGEHRERIRKRSCLKVLISDKTTKSAFIMLAVITVFVYSWTPDFVVQILHMTKSLPKTWHENVWAIRFTIYNYYISPVLNPAIYSFGYKHVRQQMISSLKRSNKSKFVSLEDGPPLLYRTTSQVEQTELFYQKVDAMRKKESPSVASVESDRASDFSARPGSVRTFSARGASFSARGASFSARGANFSARGANMLPSYATSTAQQRPLSEPLKDPSGEWIYPEKGQSTPLQDTPEVSKISVMDSGHPGKLQTPDKQITGEELSRCGSFSSEELPSDCFELSEDSSINELSFD